MSSYPCSWDIDDWLKDLGLDPDCDAYISNNFDKSAPEKPWNWALEVRIPAGDNADEYLCGLEAAWRDQFGDEPVEFKAYEPKPKFGGMLTPQLQAAVDKAVQQIAMNALSEVLRPKTTLTSSEPLTFESMKAARDKLRLMEAVADSGKAIRDSAAANWLAANRPYDDF